MFGKSARRGKINVTCAKQFAERLTAPEPPAPIMDG